MKYILDTNVCIRLLKGSSSLLFKKGNYLALIEYYDIQKELHRVPPMPKACLRQNNKRNTDAKGMPSAERIYSVELCLFSVSPCLRAKALWQAGL